MSSGNVELADSAAPATDASSVSPPPPPPPRRIIVNIHDPVIVKRTLDSDIIQCLEQFGYAEDMSISNFRIIAGLLACASALAGQFWPTATPHYSREVGLCVIGYFLLSGISALPSYFIEKDCIALTRRGPNKTFSNGLIATSKLPRGSAQYSFCLAPRDSQRNRYALQSAAVQRQVTVSDYFDVDGVFLQLKFRTELEGALDALESQKTKKSL